jgi:uncharacterized membrane protein (DUF373 family)
MPDDTPKLPFVDHKVVDLLSIMESAVYLLVSVFLVAMALLTLYQVGMDLTGFVFPTATTDDILPAIRDLMTTLIMVELIQTVIVYLKSHKLDIRLVLSAGLTAMIRRVLISGIEGISPTDMAVTALLMFALIIAIALAGERKIDIRHLY